MMEMLHSHLLRWSARSHVRGAKHSAKACIRDTDRCDQRRQSQHRYYLARRHRWRFYPFPSWLRKRRLGTALRRKFSFGERLDFLGPFIREPDKLFCFA